MTFYVFLEVSGGAESTKSLMLRVVNPQNFLACGGLNFYYSCITINIVLHRMHSLDGFCILIATQKRSEILKNLRHLTPGGGWDKHISEKNGINVLPAEGVLVFFLMPLNTT